PVMDGFEATGKIRDFEKKFGLKPIPIIAMTSRLSEDDKLKCSEIGMNAFLTKPINVERSEELIQKFIFIGKH
ncbi:response regulator, partial [bacterium]|nr:response regulator [bacterium]